MPRSGERDLRRGAALFPLVGAAVGALVALVAWGSAFVVPAFAAGVLGVACGVAVTAAIHLDGLGDIADGIGASLDGPRSSRRRCAIRASGRSGSSRWRSTCC